MKLRDSLIKSDFVVCIIGKLSSGGCLTIMCSKFILGINCKLEEVELNCGELNCTIHNELIHVYEQLFSLYLKLI